MATCIRCGAEFSSLSWLIPFIRQTGRCKKCETATQQALIGFREDFLRLANNGLFTRQKMQLLKERVANDYINLDEALEFIRQDALNLLERVLNAIVNQGPLTNELESYFCQLQYMLSVSDTEADYLLREIELLNIDRGKLPTVSQEEIQDIRLTPSEACFLIISAEYHKVTETSIQIISGRLVATNKKLRFLAETDSKEILWRSVMSIKRDSRTIKKLYGDTEIPFPVRGIYLEINKRAGGGFYDVPDPEVTEAIINALIRIANGQLVRIDSGNSHLQLQQHSGNPENEPENERKQSAEPEQTAATELAISDSKPQKALEVFYSYAPTPRDESLRKKLEKHLSILKQQGYIANWHVHKIDPGQDRASEISKHLNSADIILLLVSADFLASDYCYSFEMKRALERDKAGEAIVIPVILRPVDWENAQFSGLKPLPQDGKPVTSHRWGSQDEALLDVAKGIRRVVEQIRKNYMNAN